MKITQHSISDHTVFYDCYTDAIEAHSNLIRDAHMHWCKEDEKIEALRSIAEKAVYEYRNAIADVFHKEEEILTNKLLEKKSLFKKSGT